MAVNRFCAVFFLLAWSVAASVWAVEVRYTPPVIVADAIVIENEVCRYEIGLDGKNRAVVDRAAKKDYCQPNPLMLAGRAGKTWASSKVVASGDTIVVSFGESGSQVKAKLGARPRYFTLEIVGLSGEPLDWVQLGNLQVKISQHVGALVNAAWDEQFAVCVLACNDRTDCGSHGVPRARAYREFGIEGAKVAMIGVPTGGPDPGARLLDAIEVVELEQGLPHPTTNGVWIKRAPARLDSYIMFSGVTEQNVDQAIEFAKGAFGCIELDYWWHTTPTYQMNRKTFPQGLEGLKRAAEKIRAAGFQFGLHVMQGMVGWGAKDDPYVVPKADPRLLQDRHATLAAALDAKATEIAIQEPTKGWPEQGDLYLEGEIVRYAKLTATGFAQCQRGLHGTTVAAHGQGARIGNLVNCFPIWGNTVYCPDVKTTMVDEICDNLARVFNATGTDMSYFDAGEEMYKQLPTWRNQGRVALGVQQRLNKGVFIGGNALYTHLAWHVIVRGSPHFDPIRFGRRAYTLRFKGQISKHWTDNLLSGDVGWFQVHTHTLANDAVTPDEVALLCLKALGYRAPVSVVAQMSTLGANRRMPEIREIIRTCDELKRQNYFTEKACAELIRPMAEHLLERAADGGWDLRPWQFGPSRVADAKREQSNPWNYRNPYAGQTPWVRIRAQTTLAPYGAKENIVLADPEKPTALVASGTASPELIQNIEASPEKTPDGSKSLCYRAENRGKKTSGWCRLTLTLPKPLNLTKHRRLGLWIRTEGQGGILNVQLVGKDVRRDHYITLGKSGWSYCVLDMPEEDRFYNYAWPYSFTDLFYTCWAAYHNVRELNLYYNGLPAGSTTTCWIGRIEALSETSAPLDHPGLESGGQKIIFPVTLKPDEYLEMGFDGRCRQFEPNGGLVGEIQPQGKLSLGAGDSSVRFLCTEGPTQSSRAEVTLSVRGAPLPNARRGGSVSSACRTDK